MDYVNQNENTQMNKEPGAEDINPQEDIEAAMARRAEMDMGRNKLQHTSDTSDSDNPQPVAENSLALITPTESQGVWKKVEKKKDEKSDFSPLVHKYFCIYMFIS